jgi:hypothetical protein
LGGERALVNAITGILGQNATTESIVLMLMAGADVELITQALLQEITGQVVEMTHLSALELEMLIRTIIAEYLSNAGLADDTVNSETAAEGDDNVAYRIAAE